jgi:hypothetical protein
VSGDDDLQWLEALRGVDVGDTPAERDGRVLRGALLGRTHDVAPTPPAAEARIERLLQRADRAGLAARRRPVASGWLSGWRGVAAFAVIAALAIGLGLQRTLPPDEEIVRGTGPERVVLTVPDPAATREELVDALTEAGATAVTFEQFGQLGIDVEWPLPAPVAVRSVLDRYGLPIAGDGVLTIRIVEPSP